MWTESWLRVLERAPSEKAARATTAAAANKSEPTERSEPKALKMRSRSRNTTHALITGMRMRWEAFSLANE